MRKTRGNWLGGAAIAAALATGVTLTGACMFLGPPSHVKAGEIYLAGDKTYDEYFAEVHDLQVASTKWDEEATSARRALLDELKLDGEATEAIVVQSLHEKLGAQGAAKLEVTGEDARFVPAPSHADSDTRSLGTTLETMAKNELARAKKFKTLLPKIESLTKAGHDLEPHVAEDFAKVGGQKPFEVKKELAASYDVLARLSVVATRNAKDAEYFVADIQRAIANGPVAPSAVASNKPTETPAARPVTTVAATPRPTPMPTPIATARPAPPSPPTPAPTPPPASTGEVFNP